MAHDMRSLDLLLLTKFRHVLRHDPIIHFRRMRRPAMVALVQRKHLELFTKPAAERMPVLRRAEQAVKNDQRKSLPVALEVQLHRGTEGKQTTLKRQEPNNWSQASSLSRFAPGFDVQPSFRSVLRTR